MVTIVDVNDFEPAFPEPWTPDNPYITIEVNEEQAKGTVVHKFTATDPDSNIDKFRIQPKSKYFSIEPATGNLKIKSRIDYEALERKSLTFDLIVFDAGVPQKSATAFVVANIANLNDETPHFEQKDYQASVRENAPPGTPVITVRATDLDEGDFGHVIYGLAGAYKDAFNIGIEDGVVTVVEPAVLDREATESIVLQVVASDSAPLGSRKSSTVPVNITVLDENDNRPLFVQHDYSATVVDNIPFYPDPSPIVQVAAVDADEGTNAELAFEIVGGNEEQRFFVDEATGVVYPNASFRGLTGRRFMLTVQVHDEGGQEPRRWRNPDRATVTIDVENVNTHQPEWFPDPPPDETIQIREEEDVRNRVVLKVNARDRDIGEDNRRISYFFKVNNENVGQTGDFSIDETTGEVRPIRIFDREDVDRYELVLVARDHGTPVAFETLRFVGVDITDVNDNEPMFMEKDVRFTVPEEVETGYLVGRVEAQDADKAKNGRVFYYIVAGNEGRWFSIDKTYGNIYTKKRLDREQRERYSLQVKTTNDPDVVCEGRTCDIPASDDPESDPSVVIVQIFVEDKNDNLPRFEQEEYFVGIPFDAKVGDLILDAKVYDPDIAPSEGVLTYAIRSSNLYRSGSTVSSGSLVPSPFEMKQNGRLVLASLVTEFNQDRFVLEVAAQETSSNHRAKAVVHLWIYEPQQLIKLVIDQPPTSVNQNKAGILDELRNVTQAVVAVDDIRYHVDAAEGLKRDKTDMYVHVVDAASNTISDPSDVLKVVDANYDHLSLYYEAAGISSIVLAEDVKTEDALFDPNLAALIAMLLVLFLGLIMFSIVCCCVKPWIFNAAANKPRKLKPESSPHLDARAASVMGGGGVYNNPTSLIDEGPVSGGGGTDNPLWIDQKYKAYEEQELTMTVFSDQDNSVISGSQRQNGGSISRGSHLETQSNAYATINKLPMATSSRRSLFNGSLGFTDGGMDASGHMERDYATLEKSIRSPPGPVVPGIHSTPYQAGSLPRRFSDDFDGRVVSPSRSNLIINQHGEPELVADLM